MEELASINTDKQPRAWVEKTHVRDRADRKEGPHRIGEALWSPTRSSDGRDIYSNMREVRVGDLVLHLTDDKAITGVSIVAGPLDENFTGLPGTDWADRLCYRVPLKDFQELDPALSREWLLSGPKLASELKSIIELRTPGGVFYDEKLNLRQGAYLTQVPEGLLHLLESVYLQHSEHHLLEGRLRPESGSSVDISATAQSALEDADVGNALPAGAIWIWAPGKKATHWDEFYESGIMAIGWNEIGDFANYNTVADFKKALAPFDPKTDQGKNARMCFDFIFGVKIGDVVFAKRGVDTIVGRGIVTGSYCRDETQKTFKNTRAVQWTSRGEWKWEGEPELPQKSLTDWTDKGAEVISKLEELIAGERGGGHSGQSVLPASERESFSIEQATEGLFMPKEEFRRILKIWTDKKNLILQGAPGVGKSFVARRLAYALMKFKDPTRVRTVQFHQSYSYEDFVEGYRPSKSGFSLREGIFLNFCFRALDDPDQTYVFIIDEVNRGNLSAHA